MRERSSEFEKSSFFLACYRELLLVLVAPAVLFDVWIIICGLLKSLLLTDESFSRFSTAVLPKSTSFLLWAAVSDYYFMLLSAVLSTFLPWTHEGKTCLEFANVAVFVA